MFSLSLHNNTSRSIIPTSPSTLLHDRNSPPTCGFPGNNDAYGIGIRIGIYAQIIAVWFSNFFLISQAQVLRDSVSLFAVAILIVCIIFAAAPSDVYVVEAFVMLQILAWSCIMGVKAKSSYSKAINFGSKARKVLNEVVYHINLCLHVWFWWAGMDKMQKTPCGTFLMMYIVKTGMFGWARKVMMAMTTFVLFLEVYFAVIDFSGLWEASRMKKTNKEFTEAVRKWVELQDHEEREGGLRRSMEDEEELDRERASIEVGRADKNDSSEANTHDCRSQDSCSRCSPVEFDLTLDDEPTVVQPRLSRTPTDDSKRLSHISTRASNTKRPHEINAPTSSQSAELHSQQSLEFTILHHVYQGEIYIQHCLAATPYQRSSAGKPLPIHTIIRAILQPSKYRSSPEISTKKPIPSWFTCYFYVWKTLLTYRFSKPATIVYSHMRQSQLMDMLNGPIQTYASLKYAEEENVELPPWRAISLSSKLLLTRPDRPKKIWLAWWCTAGDLFINVIAILQLELTLYWNRVSGLNHLWTSLGQLVPFIIGIGGLILVGARWVAERWKKRDLGQKDSALEKGAGRNRFKTEQGKEIFDFDPDVREGYARWKKIHEAVPNANEGVK